MESAVEYIQAKGWQYREQSGQLVLAACPFCEDQKGHFYIRPDDGLFFCHKCQEKGNLNTLKRKMGDSETSIRPAFKKPTYKKPSMDLLEKYHQNLLGNSQGIEYLAGRGIVSETIDRFKLGLERQNGTTWITIPHLLKGNPVNVKFRSMPPAEKSFKRIQGCRSVLFNGDILRGNPKEIIINERNITRILVQVLALIISQMGLDSSPVSASRYCPYVYALFRGQFISCKHTGISEPLVATF